MAVTSALLTATAHSLRYRLTEAGTAANTLAIDAPGDVVAGPLSDLINAAAAVANQAAARALLDQLDIKIYNQLATSAGATGKPSHSVDADINGGAQGNFEFNVTGQKAADADTATAILVVTLPHSIVA